jgi:hypothetical protein
MSAVRQNCSDIRPNIITLDNGCTTDSNACNIGDRVERASRVDAGSKAKLASAKTTLSNRD